jgi:hypothetical protein
MGSRPVYKWDRDKSHSRWGGDLWKVRGNWVFLNREEYLDGIRIEEVIQAERGPKSLKRSGRYWPPGVSLSDAARYIIAERQHRHRCIGRWLGLLRQSVDPETAKETLHLPFEVPEGLTPPKSAVL